MSRIRTLQKQLAAGTLTSVALTERYLARIREYNPGLHAYLHTAEAFALELAHRADERRRNDRDVTPLTGIPLSIKDVMHVHGLPTTCASKILEHFHPTYHATTVARLLDAGAVILGKTNMDEFAMGASNEHSAYGAVRNPWDPARIPGGSSGGSAAAVSADLCVASLGSDTGGSIRQPAAFCGIVGLKPTYGRVSRYGLVAFASSLDQIGPMTQSVEDAALILQQIAGHDPADSTARNIPVPDFSARLGDEIAGVRIGIPEEYFGEGIDAPVEATVRTAIAHLESLGATTVKIHLPHTRYAVPCYYIIAPAEASANLARYDGVRFGHRAAARGNLHDLYCASRSEGFGPEVTRRIMIGTYVLSSGYYDAYYKKAQQVRTLIARDFAEAFTQVDVICTPTTPHVAFRAGERLDDPLQMYLADICTSSCNLAGLPGISVPCGVNADGMPIGLQLLGRPMDEVTLLQVAYAYEQSTSWHRHHPPHYGIGA
ncbi:MAG: Asp-tRNA(Asn)/Glu-tRNA(Gln) amidotransferase subunit GatA [Deltaproteobacteria bacterium]|nr:Asp-tRNA(Asn)/Glu-tRNA(Gln) amidotransferase subunit GatA [Deltaproteobacteria bacterium]